MVTGVALAFLLLGLFTLGGGLVGHVAIGRRSFYRRNPAGVEEFHSYGAAVTNRGAEGCLRVLFNLCVVFGILWTVGGIFGLLIPMFTALTQS